MTEIACFEGDSLGALADCAVCFAGCNLGVSGCIVGSPSYASIGPALNDAESSGEFGDGQVNSLPAR